MHADPEVILFLVVITYYNVYKIRISLNCKIVSKRNYVYHNYNKT